MVSTQMEDVRTGKATLNTEKKTRKLLIWINKCWLQAGFLTNLWTVNKSWLYNWLRNETLFCCNTQRHATIQLLWGIFVIFLWRLPCLCVTVSLIWKKFDTSIPRLYHKCLQLQHCFRFPQFLFRWILLLKIVSNQRQKLFYHFNIVGKFYKPLL